MFGAGIPPAVPAVAGNGPEGLVVLGILVVTNRRASATLEACLEETPEMEIDA
jgi:hypothetical protein